MKTFAERIREIVDTQQAAYFESGYDTGRTGQPYDNAVRREAAAGFEESCFYDEGYDLGIKEQEAVES